MRYDKRNPLSMFEGRAGGGFRIMLYPNIDLHLCSNVAVRFGTYFMLRLSHIYIDPMISTICSTVSY